TVPPPPDYASNSKFAGADRLSISAGDSPGPRFDNNFLENNPNRVAIVQGLTDIAVRFNFRIYLTWRYPPRNPQNQTVIHTVATLDWTVFFRGIVAQPNLRFPNAELPHTLGAF